MSLAVRDIDIGKLSHSFPVFWMLDQSQTQKLWEAGRGKVREGEMGA